MLSAKMQYFVEISLRKEKSLLLVLLRNTYLSLQLVKILKRIHCRFGSTSLLLGLNLFEIRTNAVFF